MPTPDARGLSDQADEFFDMDRLGEVVIEASLLEPPLVDRSRLTRQGDQHDALAPGPIPDAPCHLVPILPAGWYEAEPIRAESRLLPRSPRCRPGPCGPRAEQSDEGGELLRAERAVLQDQDVERACRIAHTDSSRLRA